MKFFKMRKKEKSMIVKGKMGTISQKIKIIRKILKVNLFKIILLLEKSFLKVHPK